VTPGGTTDVSDRDSPTGRDDPPTGRDDPPTDRDPPTVSCSRCGRRWDLSHELDDLQAGNRAVEQFALDHERHTGHYPDDATPWVLDCRRCPDGERFLAERPARRWAETHARHTDHEVRVRAPDGTRTTVSPGPE